MIENVRSLNDICSNSRKGIHKRWVLNSKSAYNHLCDYMQKINFSLQDLNSEIPSLEDAHMKDIVYVIILSAWIQEAFEKIYNLVRSDVLQNFSYGKEDELKKAKKYINAIRSFAIAHPLSTDRHPKFGFDGNYICVDICIPKHDITFAFKKNDWFYRLDFERLHEEKAPADFFFYVYSEKDDAMMSFRYIGCCFSDIYNVARLYIDKLYALDSYLRKQKKADYEA